MKDAGKFFSYARARHEIYLRRSAGRPRNEWTDDPIFQKFRFTNVFRELDKTTDWFARNVRNRMRGEPEVMLATVVFRMLNRIEVGEAVFSQIGLDGRTAFEKFAARGEGRVLRAAIKNFLPRGPYVTGAYIISSPPGHTKLDGVIRVLEGFYKYKYGKNGGWKKHAQTMLDRRGDVTLESAWAALSEIPYFGHFHSYEIVTDLRHTELLEDAPDIMTWANVGPGARRGMNRVWGLDKRSKERSSIEVVHGMRDLLTLSQDRKFWPREWPAWEMRDVEHTLCEFDKYERVRTGEGKPRGVYR